MHLGAKQAKCLLGSAGKGQRPVRRASEHTCSWLQSHLDKEKGQVYPGPTCALTGLPGGLSSFRSCDSANSRPSSVPAASEWVGERGGSPAPEVLAQGLHPATSLQAPVPGGTPCALGVPLRSPDFSLLPPVAESFLPPHMNPLALLLPE